MAIKYYFRSGQFKESPTQHMYVVDYAVGYKRDNKRDDVMLVQFFLKSLLAGRSPLGPAIAIDGVFGPTTHYWLLFLMAKAIEDDFGTRYLYRGKMPLDGGLMPPDVSQVARFSDAGLIGYMNEKFRQGEPRRYDRLESDPAVPAALRKALIHRYTSADQARILKGEL